MDMSSKNRANTKSRFTARELCFIAVGAAMTAVLAQLSIPLPAGVPLTLQTMVVLIAGIVLGTRCGTLAICVYLLLGAVGLPVFSGFRGGPGVLAGPTGGFLISFPLLAYLAAVGQKLREQGKKMLLIFLIAGVAANYAFGVLWFTVSAKSTFAAAFSACVLPFLPTDALKVLAAYLIGPLLRKALRKAGLVD